MAWDDIATPGTLDRAERLVAAGLGTFTNVHSETLATELSRILEELDGDGDEYARLMMCVASVAAMAIGAASGMPADNDTEAEAASRAAQISMLEEFVGIIRDIGNGTFGPEE